ncbi:hypothetical protein [Streptomyces sp. CAU 1734]|uniref:hypothetical protein n=1 Tax=Streptomyces sp. CAU 1734 TaxID=3140360 RepID=UPI003260F855
MTRNATDQQTRHTSLPAFRKYRPLPAGERDQPRMTVRDVFGVDGWFFDPDAAAASRPWAFAVLHLPGTHTPSGQGWAVRGVDGDRRQYGPLALTRRDAVYGASPYLHTEKPSALVRVEARRQRLVLHVRCACRISEAAVKAEFTDFTGTAAWLDKDPGARWRFCRSTPRRITWTGGAGLTQSGTVRGTCRHHTGRAVISVVDDLGCYPRVFLRDLTPDAL